MPQDQERNGEDSQDKGYDNDDDDGDGDGDDGGNEDDDADLGDKMRQDDALGWMIRDPIQTKNQLNY